MNVRKWERIFDLIQFPWHTINKKTRSVHLQRYKRTIDFYLNPLDIFFFNLKFRLSEKDTKFEKNLPNGFDVY